ncbi:ATP-NAD kinase-like domain-containing protein [Gaertneriomyces semiglobifer]|nr:ATP-NAD kinase-like domain-containing protein [Gaertneriomyces semiglobifer]
MPPTQVAPRIYPETYIDTPLELKKLADPIDEIAKSLEPKPLPPSTANINQARQQQHHQQQPNGVTTAHRKQTTAEQHVAAAAAATDDDRCPQTLVIAPTIYVFIFSNPRSGNQQGLPLVQMNIQHYRMRDQPQVQVQLYDFLDPSDRMGGLRYLNLLMCKKNTPIKAFHVWSAGGDGTLMGVLEGMIEVGIDVNDPRVSFSVIPFGTGNDLSQVLGWGRFVPGTDVAGHHLEGLNKLVLDRLTGHKTLLDIWEVTLETGEGGSVRQAGKETKLKSLTRKMASRVGAGFEEHRRGSRVLNAWEYTKQSAGVLVHGVPRVTDSVEALEADGYRLDFRQQNLRVTHEPVELIIQNIPGMWGRHIDLWGVTQMSRSILKDQRGPADISQWTPQAVYDGKLEVFGIGSLRSYLFKQFPWGRKRLQRVGQFPSPMSVCFREHSQVHLMIDGEFYEVTNPTKMTYRRMMQITMVGSEPDTSRLVRDMLERRAEQPGPTGEGERPGVDFEVGKTEYAAETSGEKKERRMSAELRKSRSSSMHTPPSNSEA